MEDWRDIFNEKVAAGEPSFEDALGTPTDKLEGEQQHAQVLFSGLGTPSYGDEQRRALGVRRYPEMHDVGRLLGEALAKNGDIAAATLVTPELVGVIIKLDGAAARIV